jgi:diguanylate cyclase (GGDEF)-like protein
MFISWFLKGGLLLPTEDNYFFANMTFRMVGLVLMLLSINIITYFGGHFLVEELEKYVNYDTLTHLLNRRSMDNYLQAAHRQAKTGQATFCLMMMDIDDFKKVNDTYGHDCGDEVLKYVAHTISTGVKKNDYVFRWGGEEILVLLNTDFDKALAAAERIRADIARDPVDYRGTTKVPVTITIGVSPYTAGATIQQMMDDADAKLYYGKKHGKNQVVGVLPDENGGDGGDKKDKNGNTIKTPALAFGLLPNRA